MEVQNVYANSRVNITAERKTYLGAVMGSIENCEKYVKGLVKNWDNQLIILTTIAGTKPQAVYLAFTSGFKSKLSYILRNIPSICHLLLPLERTIRKKSIVNVTGCYICNNKERVLTPLPTRYCGLIIPIFLVTGKIEFMNFSKKITSGLTAYDTMEDSIKRLKTEIKKSIKENTKTSLKD